MDEYRKNVEKVQKALEQDAAFLQPNPCLAQRVLNAANGKGGVVVKKKVPIALVIAIVLMLSGIVAVAATLLWQDYVPQMKQTEHELGDYVEWPAARRIQLAKDIVAMGYIEESEETQILSKETATEKDKAEAADRLMLKLTGLDDVKEVHSTLITYAIMGHEDTWTPEQRVWWNGIVTMYGDDGATDTLIVPTKDVLSEEEAIRIARAALQEAYGFDDAYMNGLQPVADLYTTDERPEYKRWNIQFKKYREGNSSYIEKVYSVIVDENGNVIEDLDIGILHVTEQAAKSKANAEKTQAPYMQVYLRYSEEQNDTLFWCWPYEVKAAYSAEMLPLMENLESLNADIAGTLIYRYGTPSAEKIQYSQALQLAQNTLCEIYKLATSEFEFYTTVYEAYDVTNSEEPKWKFVFINPDDLFGTYYRVHIGANTGEVILHEQFEWQRHSQSEEYDMKFY